MNTQESLKRIIRDSLVVIFFSGYSARASAPAPAPAHPIQPMVQSSLFNLIQTVQVTPVGNYRWSAFSRIGYVPGRDRIIVAFNTLLAQPEGYCTDGGLAYREYTTDMTATGNMGLIHCAGGLMDTGGLFVGNDFYYTYPTAGPDPGSQGFDLVKFDAVSWTETVRTFHALDTTRNVYGMKAEDFGDPMIAMVNGQIDVSSTYYSPTAEPIPLGSYGTHHQLFTTDLQFIGRRILSETPHINLSSMVFADGIYNFVTGTSLVGNLIVMRYDQNWNYLETKLLKQKSVTAEGLAFDGNRFFVSYIDVPCQELGGCYMNVRLAAFDSDWNLLDDIAVTSFSPDDQKQPGRPSLTLHSGRIYVCYDQNENDVSPPSPSSPTHDVRVYVSVYDINTNPVPIRASDGIPTEYQLQQNYPNPFNPSTIIRFCLPTRDFVTLKVYDIHGREISVLLNEFKEPGMYDTKLDATNMTNGVYFCIFKTGKFFKTIKLIVIK